MEFYIWVVHKVFRQTTPGATSSKGTFGSPHNLIKFYNLICKLTQLDITNHTGPFPNAM